MAYEYQDYLVLAWEDIKNGGDLDYNDVVMAVDFGKANLQHLSGDTQSVPEPGTIGGLAALGASLLVRRLKG